MSIVVACEDCGKKYKFSDDRGGSVARCKDCGARIDIPETDKYGGSARRRDDDEEDEAPRPARNKKKAKSRKSDGPPLGLILGLVGGVALLLVLGLAAFFVLGVRQGGGGVPVAQADPALKPEIANPADPAAPPANPGAVPATPAPAAPAVNPAAPAPKNLGVDPPPPVPGSVWAAQHDPAAAPVPWPPAWNFPVRMSGGSELIVARGPSRFAGPGKSGFNIENTEFVDLATGRPAGRIAGKTSSLSDYVLSPDGKYLALQALATGNFCKFEVWSTQSGQMLKQLQADDPKSSVRSFDFAGPGQLFVHTIGGPSKSNLRVINVETGDLIREMPGPKTSYFDKTWTVSPGGRFLAVCGVDGSIELVDLQAGKPAGSLKLKEADDSGDDLNPEALSFTPDGKSLALLATSELETRISRINLADGRKLDDRKLPGRLSVLAPVSVHYKGPQLEWLPDATGVLVGGTVMLDWETGRPIWQLDAIPEKEYGLFNHRMRRVTPSGVLIVDGPEKAMTIREAKIDWPALRKQLKDMSSSDAFVRPGAKVALNVQVGKLRGGNPEETLQKLRETMSTRLQSDGLELADAGGAVLDVKYSETAGQKLEETERSRRPLDRGKPTGKQVESTRCAIELTWKQASDQKVLWKQTLDVDPDFLILGTKEATDENVRSEVFDVALNTLKGTALPYYIAGPSPAEQLPLHVKLEHK